MDLIVWNLDRAVEHFTLSKRHSVFSVSHVKDVEPPVEVP